MKTIRIQFIGNWWDINELLFYKILKKHYNVELVNENPDYIICTIFGEKFEQCKYDCVRIMISLENYIPDLNTVDYAISPYPVKLFDRCFSLPLLYIEKYKRLETLNRDFRIEDVKNKKYFANFIAGHESENNIRGDFFKELSKYKRVESAGTYLNNMENGYTVSRFDDTKINLQKNSKFTLCFESTYHEGFLTEKLADAFMSNSIPVYFGTEMAKEVFNEKAFIYVKDREHFKEAIDKIIELDNDDEKYLDMLNEPVFNEKNFISKTIENYEKFILNIFDQPLEKAFRRSKVYWTAGYNEYLKGAVDIIKCSKKKLKEKLRERNKFKKLNLKEKFKRDKKDKGSLYAILSYIKNLFIV